MRFLLKAYVLFMFTSPLYAATFTGQLAVLVAERLDHKRETMYFIKLPDGGMLQLVGPKTAELPLMSEIPITAVITDGALRSFILGVDIDEEVAKRSSERGELGLDARRAFTFIVDMPKKKASSHTSVASAAALLNKVDEFYQEASLGQLSFPLDTNQDGSADVAAVKIKGLPETCDKFMEFAAAARKQGTKDGTFNEALYQHRIYVLPHQRELGCRWLGLAELGCRKTCDMWISYPPNLTVYVHELGHNLGFDHAATDPEDDGKINIEYGDHSDPMGNRLDAVSLFNPPHLVQAGWYAAVKPATWARAIGRGQKAKIDLAALSAPLTGEAQVIIVERAAGGHYYLGYRFGDGLDAKLGNQYKDCVGVYRWGTKGRTAHIRSLCVGDSAQIGNMKVRIAPSSVRHIVEAELQVN